MVRLGRRPAVRAARRADHASHALEPGLAGSTRPPDSRGMDNADFDVLVTGAGPVGLTMAIDLGRRGASVLLVERDPTTKEWPKMDRSNARTMEIYRRLGIAEQVRSLGFRPDDSMDVFVVTSMSAPPLARLRYPTVAQYRSTIANTTDASQPAEPYQLVAQNDLEPFLCELARSTPGVTVRFGCDLVSFTQDEKGVDATLRSSGGRTETVRTRYLAGCDGGRSTVRKTLGIKLEGRGGLADMLQVTFRSEELYEAIPIGKGRHYYFADEYGTVVIVQGNRKIFTFTGMLPDGLDLESEIRSRLGVDVDIEVRNSLRWKFHLLLAERYRSGRAFLAGDAAHLVIPTGGLGMNTGVGDAIDLSWKLAGTLAGWAGPGVLDSYEIERRAVGRRNVEAAGWAAEGLSMWRQLWAPQLTEDSAEGKALRARIGASASVHQRRVHEMVGVELGYSYAGSPLIGYEPGNAAEWDTVEYVAHTRPGIRLPHVWLADGRAIQDVLGSGYCVLDLDGDTDLAPLLAEFARVGAPVEVFASDEPNVRAVYGCSLLLVRPDLHVFWRGHTLPGNLAALADAATGHGGQVYVPKPGGC